MEEAGITGEDDEVGKQATVQNTVAESQQPSNILPPTTSTASIQKVPYIRRLVAMLPLLYLMYLMLVTSLMLKSLLDYKNVQ